MEAHVSMDESDSLVDYGVGVGGRQSQWWSAGTGTVNSDTLVVNGTASAVTLTLAVQFTAQMLFLIGLLAL